MSSRKYSENRESLKTIKNEKSYATGNTYEKIRVIAERSALISIGESLQGFDFRELNFVPLALNIPDRNLKGCIFEGLTLSDGDSRADLRWSQLNGANFKKSILIAAKLNGADLTGANLTGANLTGADLTEADLTGADLKDVIFGDTILRGATLTNVKNLNMQNLKDLAIIDDTTTLPSKPSKPSKKTFGSRVRKFFGMKSKRSKKGGKSRKSRKSRKIRKY
jgi:uncharacterized protein YjbI with pentapeptide repeats